MKTTTTLRKIKEKYPCREGWSKLLIFLGKTSKDDEELDLLTILESNGVSDCLWAFQCTEDRETIYRLIAADFAESVLHLFEEKFPQDKRPRESIQAARDFANGIITNEALAAAGAAAWEAARAAALEKQKAIIIKYLS